MKRGKAAGFAPATVKLESDGYKTAGSERKKPLTIRFPRHIYELIDQLAAESGCSRASITRKLVERGLQKLSLGQGSYPVEEEPDNLHPTEEDFDD